MMIYVSFLTLACEPCKCLLAQSGHKRPDLPPVPTAATSCAAIPRSALGRSLADDEPATRHRRLRFYGQEAEEDLAQVMTSVKKRSRKQLKDFEEELACGELTCIAKCVKKASPKCVKSESCKPRATPSLRLRGTHEPRTGVPPRPRRKRRGAVSLLQEHAHGRSRGAVVVRVQRVGCCCVDTQRCSVSLPLLWPKLEPVSRGGNNRVSRVSFIIKEDSTFRVSHSCARMRFAAQVCGHALRSAKSAAASPPTPPRSPTACT